MKPPELVLPEDFGEYAWEVEAKGWFQCPVRAGGQTANVTFYDPARLAQDVSADHASRVPFTVTRLVVIERVTADLMREALGLLPEEFFADPTSNQPDA
ncbi:hypothetical protein [Promicromonospora soli]|uniref:Uncharacterized protein n=1 Tax=Promicromonospora soli TaxID=2035533 RepID=A0A919FT49_9MICO|nr:hypothetical protein [Promicromonospora soli]GHH71568.1 hypothetical protein GCM10017772_20210 [Promicromonospora soli]